MFGHAVAVGGDLMRAAALDAAYELGVFAGGAFTLVELADRASLGRGRQRLRPLLDVLVALGVLARDDGGEGARFVVAAVPARPTVPRDGWGRLAEVIRADRPLETTGDELERRYHHHLCVAGAPAAAALAPQLAGGHLLDLGGGAGTYTRAFLTAHPDARATIVDRPEVVALARVELAAFGERVTYVGGDATGVPLGDGHDVALLANVVHLHGEATCARLVAAAARAVKPGGMVAIKELRIDDARTGPLESLLFALGMAIYTDAGDVYPPAQLRAWLGGAGVEDVRELEVADGMCLAGHTTTS
ncbi:MAG: methyltransferase [Proteobacteria bacterium]|nr:methyltransferase [Pseudomonadota bacterium]